MNLPLIGTVDLTPSGLFLVFAVLLAAGYVVWQVVEARRKAKGAGATVDGVGKAGANGAHEGDVHEDGAHKDGEPHTP